MTTGEWDPVHDEWDDFCANYEFETDEEAALCRHAYYVGAWAVLIALAESRGNRPLPVEKALMAKVMAVLKQWDDGEDEQ
jgi:hypothetical protein